MADFEFKPVFPGYRVAYDGPAVLRTVFDDQSMSVRMKNSTSKRVFVGEFRQNTTDTKTILDLFDTKEFDTTLTVLTFDPQAADPDTDSATVYFMNKPEPIYIGSSWLKFGITFREA